MLTDTHCHLTDDYCSGDKLDEVIARARDNGVARLICATSDANDMIPAIKIAEKYDNIFVTTGIHPEYAGMNPHEYLTDAVLNHPRVVGIGEIGLDYHERDDNRTAQIKLFEEQLEIARGANLPVAIHTRDADSDTAAILTGVRGVMHCFTSGWELAKIMLDRGFYFSASGILTFKNAGEIRETFAKIPTDRIVVETDSPFCAPVPYRGKTCEPFMVRETARVLAEIKSLQMDELETILEQNTLNLYPKIAQ
ncbi:MAG: TatD family hydrolase [Alphaproteobacteria bacterium]|nr:TatD family hydrolase [Alphaproteobacteria bacterium]